ncbi:MAG: hypothetical protein RB191_20770 [Terriglobia bacterium]|nr:hypothetical protein [Terriglobia bacterium]
MLAWAARDKIRKARNQRDDAVVLLITARYHSWGVDTDNDVALQREIDTFLEELHADVKT